MLTLKYKILIVVGALAVCFYSGAKVSTWKHQAEQAKIEQQFKDDLEKQRSEILAQWEQQKKSDDLARQNLLASLEQIRNKNDQLLEDLNNVEIVEPETVVKWRERVVQANCSEQSLAGFNPFGAEFVRLYNRASSQGSNLPESTGTNEAPGGDATQSPGA